MTFAYDINELCVRMRKVEDAARGVMARHADRVKPWMFHRLENLAADIRWDRQVIESSDPELIV